MRSFFDLTAKQKYFLSLMTVEDIQNDITFNAKFDALCKSNGVKIEDKHSRFSSDNSIRQEARKRIEERRKKKKEKN